MMRLLFLASEYPAIFLVAAARSLQLASGAALAAHLFHFHLLLYAHAWRSVEVLGVVPWVVVLVRGESWRCLFEGRHFHTFKPLHIQRTFLVLLRLLRLLALAGRPSVIVWISLRHATHRH